ncbi:class I SAM-dependent methyltransferase [bacterium]|nr:MAG: class I SAM-dependent methyltransferase [bacterium]
MRDNIVPEGGYRTQAEKKVLSDLKNIFLNSSDDVEVRLQNFIKYVREQELRRLLALYEIFKKVLPVKGSIIECGVYRGFGLMAWAYFSSILENVNMNRRIYGFDSFAGFPSVGKEDKNLYSKIKTKSLSSNSFDELNELIRIYDANRFLGHINKVQLIKGDAVKTIPKFVKNNKHLIVSLLFLDFDLFEPTKVALENFLPRMPRGAIIAFDELDNPIWPGETQALLETVGINKLRIERLNFDPYIGYAVIE